ncbi:hypothetical protein DENSPDRAFT_877519 [Dentipellis sp. KUC8613]|nr:hypothetical protein DENSPDRAFT_877519 [Dentipellis sp. KUC8613]
MQPSKKYCRIGNRNSVIVRVASSSTSSAKKLNKKEVQEWSDNVHARKEQAYSNLSSGSKRLLDSLAGHSRDLDDPSWVDEVATEQPADTGIELSAEGREVEYLQELMGRPFRPHYQSWATRIRNAESAWGSQMSALGDAYLEYTNKPVDAPAIGYEPFSLPVVDVYDLSPAKTLYHIKGSYYINVELLRQGFLGASPWNVSMAFSLRTLELYRALRLRQPRLSIQAWIQTLCDLHNLNYRRMYWRHFSDAFDVYLKILREVESRVDVVLGRHEDPHWRVKHSCPACQYKVLHDEETLIIATIAALDGNQSLKRARLRELLEEDPRVFDSKYWITEDLVDIFKHDVKPRSAPNTSGSMRSPQWGKDAAQVSAADGDDNDTTCTDRWKAAMNDSLKRMWDIYRETGIFLSACRHHIILWICDMIESGELAKYPLVHVDLILRILGAAVGIGYDIGCSFKSTLSTGTRTIGFVSYTIICFTSQVSALKTWKPAIDMFAKQWDADKNREISLFLLNNYKQVQQILDELPETVKVLQSGKKPEDLDYHQHLVAEREYLAARKKNSPEEAKEVEYLGLLLKHSAAENTYNDAIKHLGDPKNEQLHKRLEKCKRDAFENLETIRSMLINFELTNNIETRWTPKCEKWKETQKIAEIYDYQKALDKLEGLVVQRLFELTKMGLSGTGYKMRTHINKTLKTRCRAIQNVLTKYNAAARTTDRPQLEWKDVSTYGGLAEFDLLRECREDIRAQPWTDSRNRQAAVHTLKIERAKEERTRLNIEIRRLATWMRDEEQHLRTHITQLEPQSPNLAAHLTSLENQETSSLERQSMTSDTARLAAMALPPPPNAVAALLVKGLTPFLFLMATMALGLPESMKMTC